MQFCKIDPATGMWLGDVVVDSAPMLVPDDHTQPSIPDPSYIAVPCPGGFYWPRWDGEQWVEGKTPEEIEAIKGAAVASEPTLEARTAALETATQRQAATLDEVVTILEAIV